MLTIIKYMSGNSRRVAQYKVFESVSAGSSAIIKEFERRHLRLIFVFFPAIDFSQAAEEIAHLGCLHEFVVFIVWSVARPDLFARLDVSEGGKHDVRIVAK